MPIEKRHVEVKRRFALAVPKNADIEDEVMIFSPDKTEIIEARLTELIPNVTLSLELRLRISIQRIVAKIIQDLEQNAREALRNLGF